MDIALQTDESVTIRLLMLILAQMGSGRIDGIDALGRTPAASCGLPLFP
jgi:hypothetical protein